MNDSFVLKNPHHKNLAAKMRNTVSDLNFYAYLFLSRSGLISTPRFGLSDIERYREKVPPDQWPWQLDAIAERHKLILRANPDTAAFLFYDTWNFLHDFDETLKR